MAVTVTTGKTTTRYSRFLVEGNNLSGDSRSLASVGLAATQLDVTGWVDIMENLSGVKTLNMGAYTALFNNNASAAGVNAGTHTVLSGDPSVVATYVIGINEAPTIGAPAFSGTMKQFSYTFSPTVGAAVELSSDLQADQSAVAGWGPMLAVGTSTSISVDLGSVDNGAANANGYVWFVHVQQSDGAMGTNDWDLVIEHAPDDSTWATAVSQAAIGASVTSYTLTLASSVDRYTRVTLTKNAGTDLRVWVHQIAL